MKLTAYDIECLQTVKNKMDEDSSRHYSIHDLAGLAGMGSTKLKAAFKQYFGMGVYTYLQDERMRKAKVLLETTEKPIKLIAKGAGFAYVTNFNTAFKRKYGRTPGTLRK